MNRYPFWEGWPDFWRWLGSLVLSLVFAALFIALLISLGRR